MGFLSSRGIQEGLPAGIILPYGGITAPDGWLFCDGSPVSRTNYSRLFSAIKTTNGIGDGASTFNLPDYRGRFLRGSDGMDATGVGLAYRDPDKNSRGGQLATTFTVSCTLLLANPNITASSTSNISQGMSVSGLGIPASSYVLSVSGSIFTICSADKVIRTPTTNGTVTLTFSASSQSSFVGSIQQHQFSLHSHGGGDHRHSMQPLNTVGGGATGYGDKSNTPSNYFTEYSGTIIQPEGGNETRPSNIYTNYIIKT
jgi:microcystin-dependent protein